MISMSISKKDEKFSRLLSRIEEGEEIILKKAGKPIAKIIPFGKKGKRKLGREKGKIWMSDDFIEPLPAEILSEFYK